VNAGSFEYSYESVVAKPCNVDRRAASSALEEGFRAGTGSSKRLINVSSTFKASDGGATADDEKRLVASPTIDCDDFAVAGTAKMEHK
jgi:hypothetical protein